ncbi:hypothetical protein EON83_23715 [bacterium]|nr:MAG: hypothetical protein EON83_23715 [bacterium]
MRAKVWLIRSLVIGAIAAPLLVCCLLILSSQGLPSNIPFLSVPFIEYTDASGRTVSVSGSWFWPFVAVMGSVTCGGVAALIRAIMKIARR